MRAPFPSVQHGEWSVSKRLEKIRRRESNSMRWNVKGNNMKKTFSFTKQENWQKNKDVITKHKCNIALFLPIFKKWTTSDDLFLFDNFVWFAFFERITVLYGMVQYRTGTLLKNSVLLPVPYQVPYNTYKWLRIIFFDEDSWLFYLNFMLNSVLDF